MLARFAAFGGEIMTRRDTQPEAPSSRVKRVPHVARHAVGQISEYTMEDHATPRPNITHEIPSLPSSPQPKRTKYTEPAAPHLSVAGESHSPAERSSLTSASHPQRRRAHPNPPDSLPAPRDARTSRPPLHASHIPRATPANPPSQTPRTLRQSTHPRLSIRSRLRSLRLKSHGGSCERQSAGRHRHKHRRASEYVREGGAAEWVGEQA